MDNNRAYRAEQSLLGALMLDNAAWDRVCDLVSAGDFSRAEHRVIFEAIAQQVEAGNPFDIVTLADALERSDKAKLLDGGIAMLAMIESTTASAANAKRYAQLVREQSILRQIVSTCSDVSERAADGEDEPAAILEAGIKRMGEIAEQSQRGNGLQDMRALMRDMIEHLEAVASKDGDLLGVSTGYRDLDAKTSGFQPSDLIILAGRPSMGKSTLAMNIAENVALNSELPVLVFSLEMSGRQLVMRTTASQGIVDFSRLRHADLDDGEWARVISSSMAMQKTKLRIDDAPGLAISDIAARARKAHREQGGLALIVVDYLQLITTHGRTENRTIEVAKISQGLKSLAKSLSVPVLALSQLSRAVEQRGDKRPMMSDLRDSGGIEQDADMIAFIYRDEVYNPESPAKGVAEVIIAKQRNGETGTVRLAFRGQYCRFDSLAPGWEPPERESSKKRGKYDY